MKLRKSSTNDGSPSSPNGRSSPIGSRSASGNLLSALVRRRSSVPEDDSSDTLSGGAKPRQAQSPDSSSKSSSPSSSDRSLGHSSNLYLEAVTFLAKFPRVHARLVTGMRPEYLVDLVLCLFVSGDLSQALCSLFELEAAESGNVAFRTESPPMQFAAAVLSLDTMIEFRYKFVGHVAVCVMQRVAWTPKKLAKVVKDCIKYLMKNVPKMPEELVTLIKALGISSRTAQNGGLQRQIFFLRYLCPALAQPLQYGGLENVPEEMGKSLLAVAKALQLVANEVDPSEENFAFPIRNELRSEHASVAKLLRSVEALERGVPSPPVEKSLRDPAKFVFASLSQNPSVAEAIAADPEAKQKLEELTARLQDKN